MCNYYYLWYPVFEYGYKQPGQIPRYIPFLGGLFLTQKEFRDELGGYLTFNQGFSSAFRYSIFNGLLLAVFTYLYLAVLSPEVFSKSLDAAQTQLAAKGLSQDQIDKAMSITKTYGPMLGAIGIVIWYAILGAIVALIGAAIFKNERSPLHIADTLDNTNTAQEIDPTV